MATTRIAYIQPIGGASGDMMLGALTDLGMAIEHLEAELGKLNVGVQVEAPNANRVGVIMLQSTIAALEQLLEVQDLSVIEQTERRERQSRSASCSIPPERGSTE